MSTITVIALVEEDGFRLLQGDDLNQVINGLNTNCLNVRTHTQSTDITIHPYDHSIFVNKNVGAPTNVFLPNLVPGPNNPDILTLYPGRRFQVKDKKGDAGTNHITVIPPPPLLIDGQPSYIMQFPYESIDITFDGQGFSIM